MKPVTSRCRQVVTQPRRLVARHWPLNTRHYLCALYLVILSPLIAIHSPLICYGQTGTASISGRVTDPRGGVIPKTVVEAIQEDTNVKVTTETNADGLYYFSSLRPAGYRIVVSKDGFKQVIQSGIVLHTQDSVTLNFSLQLGSVSETVTVNANNDHMPTDSPAVGLLVNRDFVENMPLNGRSFQDLIALAPGAVSSPSEGLYSINGQRSDANYFTLDGVSENMNSAGTSEFDPRGITGVLPAQTALGTTQSLISVDSLQEFKIQTSGYLAEYGRQPGGQVELTSRSGQNDFHGSVYDFFRNEALDANSWIFNTTGVPQQAEHQNDFGGTFGGPVAIRGLYHGENKTFFFVSYEGLRLRQPLPSGIITVPTVAFRNSAASVLQPFLNAIPIPNGPSYGDQCLESLNPSYTFSCSAQWTGVYSIPSSIDSPSVRIDHTFGERLQIFFHYSTTPSTIVSYNSEGTGSDKDASVLNTDSWTVGSTWRVSQSSVNELRFNLSGNKYQVTQSAAPIGGAIPYSADLLAPSQYVPSGTAPNAFFGILLNGPTFSDLFESPVYNRFHTHIQQWNIVDAQTWTKGRHEFKFGADFRHLRSLYENAPTGFQYVVTSASSVQQGIADEILVSTVKPGFPTFVNLSLFAQDSWKVTSRATIDYGVRWEFNPPPGAANGIYPPALTNGSLADAAVAPSGTPIYHTVYSNFAPRIGFAYQLNNSQDHPVVLRGGFGVFYDTGQNLGANGYTGPPFSATNVILGVPLPAPVVQLAPPSLQLALSPPYPFGLEVSDPNLVLPRTNQWNVSLGAGLTPQNTLTISYVGNVGNKLI
jgi:hypothetical protein